jgi:hypothetical protein
VPERLVTLWWPPRRSSPRKQFCQWSIHELFFQAFGSLCGGGAVFSKGAGDVAKRGFLLEGSPEFRQRTLALGIAVSRATEQAGFLRHGVLGGMLGMVAHLKGLGGVGQDGRVLCEGGSATEKTESDDCGLHKIDPIPGENCLKCAECLIPRASACGRGNPHTKPGRLGFELGEVWRG